MGSFNGDDASEQCPIDGREQREAALTGSCAVLGPDQSSTGWTGTAQQRACVFNCHGFHGGAPFFMESLHFSGQIRQYPCASLQQDGYAFAVLETAYNTFVSCCLK